MTETLPSGPGLLRFARNDGPSAFDWQADRTRAILSAMTIRVTPNGLRAFTIADMERMVETGILDHDERIELIAGDLVPMCTKGSRHETLKIALNLLWSRACPEGFMFAQEPGFRLDPHNYLEPDFFVFARTKRFVELEGSDVLLVVEVADSSLGYDLGRKARVYASFGVRELWVVDAARRVIHRHDGVTPEGYTFIDEHSPAVRLVPRYAPEAFGFAVDGLEAL